MVYQAKLESLQDFARRIGSEIVGRPQNVKGESTLQSCVPETRVFIKLADGRVCLVSAISWGGKMDTAYGSCQ
jgi:hypothetical protein